MNSNPKLYTAIEPNQSYLVDQVLRGHEQVKPTEVNLAKVNKMAHQAKRVLQHLSKYPSGSLKKESKGIGDCAEIAVSKLENLQKNGMNLNRFYSQYDTNKKGRISYKDFTDTMLHLCAGIDSQEIMTLATNLDREKTGTLSYTNLVPALKSLSRTVPKSTSSNNSNIKNTQQQSNSMMNSNPVISRVLDLESALIPNKSPLIELDSFPQQRQVSSSSYLSNNSRNTYTKMMRRPCPFYKDITKDEARRLGRTIHSSDNNNNTNNTTGKRAHSAPPRSTALLRVVSSPNDSSTDNRNINPDPYKAQSLRTHTLYSLHGTESTQQQQRRLQEKQEQLETTQLLLLTNGSSNGPTTLTNNNNNNNQRAQQLENQILSSLSSNLNHLRFQCHRYDLSKSGYLSGTEIATVLQKTNHLSLSSDEIHLLLQRINNNNNCNNNNGNNSNNNSNSNNNRYSKTKPRASSTSAIHRLFQHSHQSINNHNDNNNNIQDNDHIHIDAFIDRLASWQQLKARSNNNHNNNNHNTNNTNESRILSGTNPEESRVAKQILHAWHKHPHFTRLVADVLSTPTTTTTTSNNTFHPPSLSSSKLITTSTTTTTTALPQGSGGGSVGSGIRIDLKTQLPLLCHHSHCGLSVTSQQQLITKLLNEAISYDHISQTVSLTEVESILQSMVRSHNNNNNNANKRKTINNNNNNPTYQSQIPITNNNNNNQSTAWNEEFPSLFSHSSSTNTNTTNNNKLPSTQWSKLIETVITSQPIQSLQQAFTPPPPPPPNNTTNNTPDRTIVRPLKQRLAAIGILLSDSDYDALQHHIQHALPSTTTNNNNNNYKNIDQLNLEEFFSALNIPVKNPGMGNRVEPVDPRGRSQQDDSYGIFNSSRHSIGTSIDHIATTMFTAPSDDLGHPSVPPRRQRNINNNNNNNNADDLLDNNNNIHPVASDFWKLADSLDDPMYFPTYPRDSVRLNQRRGIISLADHLSNNNNNHHHSHSKRSHSAPPAMSRFENNNNINNNNNKSRNNKSNVHSNNSNGVNVASSIQLDSNQVKRWSSQALAAYYDAKTNPNNNNNNNKQQNHRSSMNTNDDQHSISSRQSHRSNSVISTTHSSSSLGSHQSSFSSSASQQHRIGAFHPMRKGQSLRRQYPHTKQPTQPFAVTSST
jgi:trimeric autotransporter adhesin